MDTSTSSKSNQVVSGLEGVVVAETRLSDVDGEAGKLTIGGYDIEEICGEITFEEVCGLLWQGGLPDKKGREELAAELGRARCTAYDQLDRLGDALSATDAMAALRAAVAHLSPAPEGRDAAELTGAVAVFAAAWARRQAGQPPVAPNSELDHAHDYLRMVRGAAPDDAAAAALGSYLVTVSDHGMNASTFTARVVASTGSDSVSAVVAALGALKGPLHGGAPGPVLDMLDSIGKKERAADWLEAELLAGRRIMGMGHRIYRVRDPRALVLERAIERLERAGVRSRGRLELARAVERAAEGVLRTRHPNRPLHANVEFYTAVLLDALMLPRTLFSATFAVGRVAGWCAHIEEQSRTGRLIRPASRYVGKVPGSRGTESALAR